ncbi:MAG: tetratricopeptide repeat protein, partial [Blastocatellia bacterium]
MDRKHRFYKLLVNTVLLVLLWGVSSRPTVNAPDLGPSGFVGIGEASGESDSDALTGVDSFTRDLYLSAQSLSHDLRIKPIETRTPGDYRRVIDGFETVSRTGNANIAARALAQAADLLREMADAAGDYASYQKAIDTYRRITTEYPNSTYVGYALISIAQIYEESLQDLDGAVTAYREASNHFPNTVMGRETRAILLRLETELHGANRPPDVTVPAIGSQPAGAALLDNVRNFTGPGYARVVLDLSNEVRHQARKAGNRVDVALTGTAISPTLFKRRFIIGDAEFLSRITVSENGGGSAGTVIVSFETMTRADYSAFQLSGPERLIIDLREAISQSAAGVNVDAPRP